VPIDNDQEVMRREICWKRTSSTNPPHEWLIKIKTGREVKVENGRGARAGLYARAAAHLHRPGNFLCA